MRGDSEGELELNVSFNGNNFDDSEAYNLSGTKKDR